MSRDGNAVNKYIEYEVMEKGKIWRIIKSDSTGRGDRREVKWGAVQSGAMTAAKKKAVPTCLFLGR